MHLQIILYYAKGINFYMNKLKEQIKKKELLMFFSAIVKGICNKENRKKIIETIFGNRSFYVERYGDLNFGRIIYYVYINSDSGFCVLYKNILKYIFFAQQYGMIPVIEFSDKIRYAGLEGRAFDSFFTQPGKITCDVAKMSYGVVKAKSSDVKAFSKNTSYDYDNEDIDRLAIIHRGGLKLNQTLFELINKEISELFINRKVLGIHVRGTDFNINYRNHPVFVSTESFLDRAIKEYDTCNCDIVFLATDEIEILRKFREVFGNKLVFFECNRSEDKTAVHFKRETNGYQLGKEVLRDVYALAKCSIFIGGRSNVSLMARVVNRAFYDKYEKEIILDNGNNNKGRVLPKNK